MVPPKSSLVYGLNFRDYALFLLWQRFVRSDKSHNFVYPLLGDTISHSNAALAAQLNYESVRWSSFRHAISSVFSTENQFTLEFDQLILKAATEKTMRRQLIERLWLTTGLLEKADDLKLNEELIKFWRQTANGFTKKFEEKQFLSEGLIAAHNDEYAWAAAVLAFLDHRPFIIFDDFSELEARLQNFCSETATFFFAAEHLPQQRLGSLLGYSNKLFHNKSFGIFTARTFSSVTWLVAKTLLYRGLPRKKSISIVEGNFTNLDLPLHEVMSVTDFTSATGHQLLKEQFDVVALAAHGDPIDANLSQAVLCGRNPQALPQKISADHLTHTCLESTNCRRDKGGKLLRLPVRDIRCRLLFSETCTGINISGGPFPEALSLALSTLDGSSQAYISTIKIIQSTGVGPILINALLASGFKFGAATKLMSQIHQAVSKDLPAFLLIGDAEASLTSTYDVKEFHFEDFSFQEWIMLDLAGFDGCLVRVEIAGGNIQRFQTDSWFHAELLYELLPGAANRIYTVAVPEPLKSILTVFIFSSEPLNITHAKIKIISAGEADNNTVEVIDLLSRNITQLRYMQRKAYLAEGLRDEPPLRKFANDLSESVAEAENVLYQSYRLLNASRHRVKKFPQQSQPDSLGNIIRQSLQPIDDFLAEQWHSWNMPHYIAPFYDGLLFDDHEELAALCYLCEMQTADFIMQCPVGDELRRKITHCPRCGILSDRAAHDSLIEIEGPSEIWNSTKMRQTFKINNKSGSAQYYAGALGFEGPLDWFRYSINPTSQSGWVPAYGTSEFVFEIDIAAESLAGVYNLVGFTSHSLEINISVKPILVRRRESLN